MPGRAFNTSPWKCIRGSVLAELPGTVCNTCYARKGRYNFKKVKLALEKRELAFYHPNFVEAMATLISKQSPEVFRWFDAGDLQNEDQLDIICQICNATPDTKHWLPTRERGIINKYFTTHLKPSNLVVRISADVINCFPILSDKRFVGSAVKTKEFDFVYPHYLCPSKDQDNKCLNCRACWDENVQLVVYREN